MENTSSAGGNSRIGIAIPVYNEAAILQEALANLREKLQAEDVVVADGGSADGSAEIAGQFFPVLRLGRANRAAQMNVAAQQLHTDVLLFLHADSRLPAGFQSEIRIALADASVAGGCFRLQFDARRPLLRFYAWFTQFRGRFFHFGDQGFFVRREIFEKLGGYHDAPLMEDVDLLRRLKRQGKFCVLPCAITTSSRRFLRRGILRQMFWDVALVTLFELSVPPEMLARFYPPVR